MNLKRPLVIWQLLSIAVMLFLYALLPGCSGIAANRAAAEAEGNGDEVATLLAFTAGDLRAAMADATAHNDAVSLPCWTKLLERVQAIQSGGTVGDSVAGAFSAFQKKRDIVRNVQSGSQARSELTIACAPLLMDERGTILRVAGMVGVRVALGGL